MIMPRDLSIDQLTLYLAELGESPLKILLFTVNKHQVYCYFTVWFGSLSATQVRSEFFLNSKYAYLPDLCLSVFSNCKIMSHGCFIKAHRPTLKRSLTRILVPSSSSSSSNCSLLPTYIGNSSLPHEFALNISKMPVLLLKLLTAQTVLHMLLKFVQLTLYTQ